MDATAKALGNSPAYPWGEHGTALGGLTVRQLLAGMAMQGMCASHTKEDGNFRSHMQGIAECAVDVADALLAELAKEQP